jgi:hypothetical protein
MSLRSIHRDESPKRRRPRRKPGAHFNGFPLPAFAGTGFAGMTRLSTEHIRFAQGKLREASRQRVEANESMYYFRCRIFPAGPGVLEQWRVAGARRFATNHKTWMNALAGVKLPSTL